LEEAVGVPSPAKRVKKDIPKGQYKEKICSKKIEKYNIMNT